MGLLSAAKGTDILKPLTHTGRLCSTVRPAAQNYFTLSGIMIHLLSAEFSFFIAVTLTNVSSSDRLSNLGSVLLQHSCAEI